MRRALLALWLLLPWHAAASEPLWQTLPPTPAPVPGEHRGHAEVNGISLYYATIGHGSPVVLLHGGLSNSDYWGHQIKALAPRHTVIVPQLLPNLKSQSRCIVVAVCFMIDRSVTSPMLA